MIWYHDNLLFFYAAPDVRCAVCQAPAPLRDAADGTAACDSECLEVYWMQRMDQAAARWRIIHDAREAWEAEIVAESLREVVP
jgi:hypothetical protein